jgi:hypothetical protein
MRRREFITLLGGTAAATWPLSAGGQQSTPTIGYIATSSAAVSLPAVEPFRRGLAESGYVEGRNVNIEIPVGRQSI